jgi:hypothetical protein
MPSCLVWGEERHQECAEFADQGYNECSATRDEGYRDCCDWAPCSWFCDAWVWVSNIVCVAWTWISNVVCVSWTWITTAVCVVWDVLTTVINAVLVTIESILGWVLSALAFVLELIFAIPVIGTFLRWLLNIITHVVFIVVGLLDAGLGLIGIRPEKLLRVCTVILRDERGTPVASVDFAKTMLQLAADVYKRDANVRIVPLRPFKYSTGFLDAETVDDSWVITDASNSDASLLDVPCNAGGAGADWLGTGSGYQLKSSLLCFFGSWRRVTGYGAPVTCFIIRSLPSATGLTLGCALWITDYATVMGESTLPPTSPRTLAHELGHACNLYHVCVDLDNRNLMATTTGSDVLSPCNPSPSAVNPDRTNPRMDNLQVIAVRLSKHVTYF